MNICLIMDNPETPHHPVIAVALRQLSTTHNVRLLDVRTLASAEAIAEEERHPLADLYLLKSHAPQALDVALVLEQKEALVVNSWASSVACQDRVLMAQQMREANLPWPYTWSFATLESLLSDHDFLASLSFPLIIKSHNSHRDDLVGKLNNIEQLQALAAEWSQEPVVLQEKPDWVVVVGDVNSTLACALVCVKLGVKVAHVEAGLRSFDRAMPEEINRLVTDSLADLLFTTSRDADENLKREGVDPSKIHFVGNVMIDTLLKHREKAAALRIEKPKQYALVTLHRPSNVDDPKVLGPILQALEEISRTMPVLFPIHPRTQKRVRDLGLSLNNGVRTMEPLGYLEFLNLESSATVVLTDSGGLQEETTILGVPCLTLRHNTERPVTITHGTNIIVGPDEGRILHAFRRIMMDDWKPSGPPELWDGCAASRIVRIIREFRR